MSTPDGAGPIRGRGVSSNPANRFERLRAEPVPGPAEPADRPRTEFLADRARSVIARNNSPDVPFDRSVNPYRGCEHGCAYCYARPTHEFLGFSAGLDFETRIMVKHDAPELLRRELSARSWTPRTVVLSGVTDPYQPVERRLELTRRCLEVLAEFRNPVTIITKNQLVVRDIDLLGDLAAHRAAAVLLSVTTLRNDLQRRLEPRTSVPANRLEAIRALRDAGIPVGVMVAPIIPGLTDEEILPILKAAGEAGAQYAGKVVLRLPLAVAPLFEQWLREHEPLRAERVLRRLRALRDGGVNQSEFGLRMRGSGEWAEQIEQWFRVGVKAAGIPQQAFDLSAEAFRHPPGPQLEFDWGAEG